MFNSSPITTWDGATIFGTFMGGAGVHLWFWLAVICCLIPLFVSLKAEKKAEDDHKE